MFSPSRKIPLYNLRSDVLFKIWMTIFLEQNHYEKWGKGVLDNLRNEVNKNPKLGIYWVFRFQGSQFCWLWTNSVLSQGNEKCQKEEGKPAKRPRAMQHKVFEKTADDRAVMGDGHRNSEGRGARRRTNDPRCKLRHRSRRRGPVLLVFPCSWNSHGLLSSSVIPAFQGHPYKTLCMCGEPSRRLLLRFFF